MKKRFTKNFRKKSWILLGTLCLITASIHNYGYASAQPDAFIVEVQPSSFDMNQAVDLTIKAVDLNGNVIQDYQGDIFIEVNGLSDVSDYVVPSDGLYTFTPQDQGVKTFSKGLVIKKEGTFSVKASDINETIKGEQTIIVGTTSHNDASTSKISIITPADGGIEKSQNINVIASAPDLPNSPYSIYLNNTIISQGTTDEIGDINTYLTGTDVGSNQLQVKISNANNEIMGESETIQFTYSPIQDGIFNSIQVLPSTKIMQGTKATFNVNVDDSVTSAKIYLSQGLSSPLDKTNDGLFSKDLLLSTEGAQSIDVELIYGGKTKLYTGVATILVEKNIQIGKIRLYSDSVDKTKLNVTRETIGTAPKYKVAYGTSDTQLLQSVVVSTNEIVVDNLTIGQKYYFQITPLDAQQQTIGAPSTITQVIVGGDVSCIVKGIQVSTQQIGDKYYLVRSGVDNVDSYLIYRSDFETSDIGQMQKVGETTGTMFEYPFNKASKKDQYAYYLVEAACKDGTNIKMDTVKKVKVGPVENILLFIVVSTFIYCMYRLYRYAKE